MRRWIWHNTSAVEVPFPEDLELNLDAQTEVYANNDQIRDSLAQKWHDRSGNSRDTGDTGSGWPTFKTSSNINSKQSVHFGGAGSGESIIIPADGSLSGAFAIAAVHYLENDVADAYIVGNYTDATNTIMGWEPGSRLRFLGGGSGGYFASGPTMATVKETSARVIVRVTGGQATLWVNGTKYDSITFSPGSALSYRGIGCFFTGGSPQRFFKGDIGQILYYSKDCSDGNITTIDDYLKSHWGLP
jgi:hypothetical protein